MSRTRLWMRSVALHPLWLAALVWCAPCRANGRFPAADQLLFDPGDAAHLLLRATYGLLESHDGGQSWTWTCEAAVGYSGDPTLALLGGGDVLAGFLGSVSLSREGGCRWDALALATRYRYPFDATLDAADPSRAWVLAGSVDGTLDVSLLLVNAAGVVEQVSSVGTGFVPVTLEVAPSNSARIYVTAVVENEAAVLLRSDDRGLTWQRFAIAGFQAFPVYIGAVDPSDPDRLYARVSRGAVVQSAALNGDPSDRLLVSSDAGQSWNAVFSLDADMLGFALSPDGSRIAVGGPGPGVYTASARDFDFRPAAPVQGLRCLRWNDDGLFACGQENLDGWTLARSTDQGMSFEALWHQQTLTPRECSAPASGARCGGAWPDIARSIQADPALVASLDGPVIESPGKSSVVGRERGCDLARGPSRSARWAACGALLGWLVRRRRA